MTTQVTRFEFPMSYEKAQEIFGQFTQRYPQDTYHSIQDICYHSGGRVTNDNGSDFNYRVDEYTLGNGTKVTRNITGHVDQGYGITDHYWSVTRIPLTQKQYERLQEAAALIRHDALTYPLDMRQYFTGSLNPSGYGSSLRLNEVLSRAECATCACLAGNLAYHYLGQGNVPSDVDVDDAVQSTEHAMSQLFGDLDLMPFKEGFDPFAAIGHTYVRTEGPLVYWFLFDASIPSDLPNEIHAQRFDAVVDWLQDGTIIPPEL